VIELKIALCKLTDDVVVAEFNVEINNKTFVITPSIYDNIFLHLYDDLLFIKTKWLTYYLNYMRYEQPTKPVIEIKEGIINDILEMLEHEMISCRLIDNGSYKVVCSYM
jgi:hypothetical protein